MARTWLSIAVELLGGRGEELWPYPGRIFAVGPAHTFEDLADAINTAFARWDIAHLSEFTLSDGTVVEDPAYQDDLGGSLSGPIAARMEMSSTKVARTVAQGEQFQFVFDFGDNWVHQCTVHEAKVDPMEVLGIRPKKPLAYWGWGNMPDQYGRRWDNDDGQSRIPSRPAEPHPMLSRQWPTTKRTAVLDMTQVRSALHTGDADQFISAITGPDIDDALQQLAAGVPLLSETPSDEHKTLVLSLINRLTWRSNPGDHELAEDLTARLRNEPLPGREVPVELESVIEILEGDPGQISGGYLDLHTGAVCPDEMADMDVRDNDSERFVWFDRVGSREAWQDMADFAQRQFDAHLRTRLEQAIRGKGAFRAFRDVIHDTGLVEQWDIFSTDRQIGRAREFLATHDIRPTA